MMTVDRARARIGVDARTIPVALAGAGALAQIAYPLVHDGTRDRLTVLVVVLFAAASITHAAVTCGARVAGLLLVATAGIGLCAEIVGVHTGVPFGTYHYRSTLGPRVLGVPLTVALAWTMLAWPAALAARRLVTGFVARVIVGAWALAAWDLFLDPQMVSAGQWHWRFPAPHLPGVASVPLTNYAGWLFVTAVISLALQGILGSRTIEDDLLPVAIYLWTYAASVLALAAFLGLGGAAAWGALGMGVVAVPLALSLARR
jgi:putative membrane protein